MAGYVVRRLLQAIPILFGVAVISFGLVHLAPGDPIDRFRTPTVRPEQLEGLIRLYGLDRPIWRAVLELDHDLRPGLAPGGLGLLVPRRPAGAPQDRRAAAGDPAARRHRPAPHRRAGHPARHPGRGQAVQLRRSAHHQPRHHRLRDPLVPARDLPALLRRRRARLVPALRHGELRQRGRPARHRLAPRPAGRQRWPCSRWPAGRATCAPRCSRSCTRTTSAPRAPRACPAGA